MVHITDLPYPTLNYRRYTFGNPHPNPAKNITKKRMRPTSGFAISPDLTFKPSLKLKRASVRTPIIYASVSSPG